MIILPFNGQRSGPNFTWSCEGSPDPRSDQYNMHEIHQTGGGNKTLCGVDLWWQRDHLAGDIRAYFGGRLPDLCKQVLAIKNRDSFNANIAGALACVDDLRILGPFLFELAYLRCCNDVSRIHNSVKFKEKYGDLPELPSWVMDLIVDLRFRGDWRPYEDVVLVRAYKSRNWNMFLHIMLEEDYWPNVPENRFERRAEYAQAGWESMQPTQPHSLAIEQTKSHLHAALEAVEKIGA